MHLPQHDRNMEAPIGDMPVVAQEPPVMDTVLVWVGFERQATRDRLREEGFESFTDLATMKEKDIRDLAESYGRRTVADGRSIFGLRRIRYLIGLIHWVQDFARVGEQPTLVGIEDMASFREALDTAFYRADVRKIEKDQADTVSKAKENSLDGNQHSSITSLRFLASVVSRCHMWFAIRNSQKEGSTMAVSMRRPLLVPHLQGQRTRQTLARCIS